MITICMHEFMSMRCVKHYSTLAKGHCRLKEGLTLTLCLLHQVNELVDKASDPLVGLNIF